MADVSEIMKLDNQTLGQIQSIVSLFHLLGLSDEEISLLPQVLKNWPKAVENINKMGTDLEILKKQVGIRKAEKQVGDSDDSDSLRDMFGFGNSDERVRFGNDKEGDGR